MGPVALGNEGEYDLAVPVQVQGADALLLVAHDGSVELRPVQVRTLLYVWAVSSMPAAVPSLFSNTGQLVTRLCCCRVTW